MVLTTSEKYKAICQSLGVQPLSGLVDSLGAKPSVIDTRSIYLPHSHFTCICQLIRERSDIGEIFLDGAVLNSDDIGELKASLVGSCVASISLKGVKLDSLSGTLIHQLCVENTNITSINLEDTLLPSITVSKIELSVEINSSNAEITKSNCIDRSENKLLLSRRLIASTEKKRRALALDKIKEVLVSSSLRQLIAFPETLFTDPSFVFEDFKCGAEGKKILRLNDIYLSPELPKDTVRGTDSEITPSPFYDNSTLCSAFNALERCENLRIPQLVAKLPDAGFYVFRLFANGIPLDVAVDDYIPCTEVGGLVKPFGFASCEQPLYAALLEKAVAKVVGGYQEIPTLSFTECVEILTGCISFQIKWSRLKLKSKQSFELLRKLIERKQTLLSCVFPATPVRQRAAEDIGLNCSSPYIVIGTGVCRKENRHYGYLVQLNTPICEKQFKYSLMIDEFKPKDVGGRRIIWVLLEDFFVIFENSFALMWPHEGPHSSHKVILKRLVQPSYPPQSTLFSRNPCLLLMNRSVSNADAVLSFSWGDDKTPENWVQVFFYEWPTQRVGNLKTRRYNVGEKNCLASSQKLLGGDGSAYFPLGPSESIQVVISSLHKCKCNTTVLSVDGVACYELPDTCFSTFCVGILDFPLDSKYSSNKLFLLINTSSDIGEELILVLGQEITDNPPHPLTILGWCATQDCSPDLMNPDFSFDPQSETVFISKAKRVLKPGEGLYLLPCCYGTSHTLSFEFTIYCSVPLLCKEVSVDSFCPM